MFTQYVAGRPYDSLVEARLPLVTVRAFALEECSVDHVKDVFGPRLFASFAVGLASILEPLCAIAAEGAAAADTEERLVTSFQPMWPVDIVPGIALFHVNGTVIVPIKELGGGRYMHGLIDANNSGGHSIFGEGSPVHASALCGEPWPEHQLGWVPHPIR